MRAVSESWGLWGEQSASVCSLSNIYIVVILAKNGLRPAAPGLGDGQAKAQAQKAAATPNFFFMGVKWGGCHKTVVMFSRPQTP